MLQVTEKYEKYNENKEFKLLFENRNNLTGHTFRDTSQILPKKKQP